MADNFDINYETLKEFYEAVKDDPNYYFPLGTILLIIVLLYLLGRIC